MTDNPYVKQFPELMAGKTVLYCHGFASSGQSGTVARLREVMPQARVIAPDLPIRPADAASMLRDICQQEQPDLIIGTSMGGMYAEQLYGYDRICVNPAMEMGETMRTHGMTGTQQFQNPRRDGIQEFYVDKALVKAYKEQSEQRFRPDMVHREGELGRVWGLFGDEDTTVDTFDMFHAVYPQALRFHGEHRMNDRSFMHSVVPVIRWIDDRQEGRERPVVYIGMECMTAGGGAPGGGVLAAASAQKAVRQLIEHYQVYFVGPADHCLEQDQWLEQYVNVPAWHHAVYTHRRDLLYGDYQIAAAGQCPEGALTTLIEYGSDTFKTWDDIIGYFARLGGQ